ncbi:hypothetical protein [Paenibacillus polymyxa]|uniref:hypothetical protein n=1 Tax=Paenibacillus polymyxa TaxID=1406 RepID=UPI000F9E7EC6|nr:hypothetical protein [Paenibacillus polymyxa]MDU8672525.1 hypothetical protein [Paenibacillus polymyxa]MDU8697432.1 hypothetical protein [Paenibacillus polymyxa]URJ56595.1 hypothetical protein MF623_001267 [Paenibacillus polymyxa]URJ64025.1 hypothetical protein MF620_003650 [Paenibacillus polymyxa]URJ71105.1 hypothetical protein MF624_001258 [Paenibacillus polymyxa]
MKFEITDDMITKITEWDTCKPVDVTGAKFEYTFIPTGIGLVIQVKCDVCERTLSLSDDL